MILFLFLLKLLLNLAFTLQFKAVSTNSNQQFIQYFCLLLLLFSILNHYIQNKNLFYLLLKFLNYR
jgi:hypothetical protein